MKPILQFARMQWGCLCALAAVLPGCGSSESVGDGGSFRSDVGSADDAATQDAATNSRGVDGGGGIAIDALGSQDTTEAQDGGGPDAPANCVPQSFVLATVPPNGGSACSFSFTREHTVGLINLLLTPGWGTVCHAGSSQGCGNGASADGWWISGDRIALCNATCERFYKQTQAGKLTVRLGCPTEACTH